VFNEISLAKYSLFKIIEKTEIVNTPKRTKGG
jgi:hypothetical protein